MYTYLSNKKAVCHAVLPIIVSLRSSIYCITSLVLARMRIIYKTAAQWVYPSDVALYDDVRRTCPSGEKIDL